MTRAVSASAAPGAIRMRGSARRARSAAARVMLPPRCSLAGEGPTPCPLPAAAGRGQGVGPSPAREHLGGSMTRAAALRARLAEPRILIAPGAADALTARVIAEAGFEAVYMTG